MNITSWNIYWITRLDAIKDTMIGIIIVLGILLFFLIIALVGEAFTQDTADEAQSYFRLAKYCALSF